MQAKAEAPDFQLPDPETLPVSAGRSPRKLGSNGVSDNVLVVGGAGMVLAAGGRPPSSLEAIQPAVSDEAGGYYLGAWRCASRCECVYRKCESVARPGRRKWLFRVHGTADAYRNHRPPLAQHLFRRRSPPFIASPVPERPPVRSSPSPATSRRCLLRLSAWELGTGTGLILARQL